MCIRDSSEPVNGFTASDIVVSGGAKGTFTGSDGDSTYTLVVTPPADATGTITVDVAQGVATDGVGNPNTAAIQATQAFDTQAPTLAITDDINAAIATGDVTFSFGFSEPVNGFTASDITVSGGTKGTFTGSDGDSTYTLVVTPTPNSAGTITLDVGANAVTDAAGNPNTAAVQVCLLYTSPSPRDS